MRILPDFPDWRDQYIVDVQTAENELLQKSFIVKHNKPVIDVYSLPAHHHQTFFAKIVMDHEIYKLVYAKPLQNSVWFSDLQYMYTFEEADRFRDDPKRKGRIICGMKILNKLHADGILDLVGRISSNQPTSAVVPSDDAYFTAIRVYDDNKRVLREFLYTDASLLRLHSDCDAEKTVEALNGLSFKLENFIGKGESETSGHISLTKPPLERQFPKKE